jgi:hypothetical protein
VRTYGQAGQWKNDAVGANCVVAVDVTRYIDSYPNQQLTLVSTSGAVLAEVAEGLAPEPAASGRLVVAAHPALPRLIVANSEAPGQLTTYSFLEKDAS